MTTEMLLPSEPGFAAVMVTLPPNAVADAFARPSRGS